MRENAPDHLGVLRELTAGTWRDPASGRAISIPLRAIEIEETLAGRESDIIRRMHGDARIGVVCDENTSDILGQRVARGAGDGCGFVVLRNPKTTEAAVDDLRRQTRDFEALIAVGSGTINDLVKYATFLDGKSYSAFPTSPMNAYTTGTASITVDGVKRSLPAHSARGVFFDLSILAACPRRLINNGLSDVVCRATAQVDWLLSRALRGTRYDDAPYLLLARDEKGLFAAADRLREGDLDALATLARTCALNGLGASIVGTTHAGSMAEHMISHYLDMFAGDSHPGTLHGEQVGVASLTMARIQSRIFNAAAPPRLAPPRRGSDYLEKKFGARLGGEFARSLAAKSLSAEEAESWNRRLAAEWDDFAAPMRRAMMPAAEIEKTLAAAGAHVRPESLGYAPSFYREAVRHARFIRDRFTALDIADDGGWLEEIDF